MAVVTRINWDIDSDGQLDAANLTNASGGGGGGGGENVTLIDEYIGDGTADTFTFSSIPQTYDSIYIDFACRTTGAFSSDNVSFYINGDTTDANYHGQLLRNLDGTVSGLEFSSPAIITIPGTSAAANGYTTGRIEIPAYKETFGLKGATSYSDLYLSTDAIIQDKRTIFSESITAAITSITLTVATASNNYDSNTYFRLYGITEGTSGGSGGSGSGSSIRVFDAFVDTNGTLITAHTPDLDETDSGLIEITRAGVALTPGSTDIQLNEASLNLASHGFGVDAGVTEGVVSIEFTADTAASWFELLARWQDSDNYISLQLRPSLGDITIQQRSAGVDSFPTATSFSWSNGASYTASLEVKGGLATANVRRNDSGTSRVTTTYQLTEVNAFSGTIFGAARTGGPAGTPTINTFAIGATGGGGGSGGTTTGARVTKSAVQSIPNGVTTDLTFDGEDFDDENYHDNVTNNERLTIPETGWYTATLNVRWADNGNGSRLIGIRLNDTIDIGNVKQLTDSASAQRQSVNAIYYFTAGDYITGRAFQDSGGNLDVNNVNTHLSIAKLTGGGSGGGSGGGFSDTVGDGASTSIAVTHNLGTRDVSVTVYRNSSPYDEIVVATEHTDDNTVTFQFVSAPAVDEYSVFITSGGGSGGGREVLTANRTYYVATTGSDSNDGLTVGTPFLTIQKAVDTVASIDPQEFDVEIQLADGTYDEVLDLKSHIGGTRVIIRGNIADRDLVIISNNSVVSSTITTSNLNSLWGFRDLTLGLSEGTAGPRYTLDVENSYITLRDCRILADASGVTRGIQCRRNGVVHIINSIDIEGSFGPFVFTLSANSSVEAEGITLNLISTPSWTTYYAFILLGSTFNMKSQTINGSATGNRYNLVQNSVLRTTNGLDTDVPGSVAGNIATGGILDSA